MTSQKTNYPHQGATDRLREPKDRLKDARDRAQDVASDVAEQARQYGEKAQDAARQFKPYVERSLRERPLATLAGAAVVGFVLGALWKR